MTGWVPEAAGPPSAPGAPSALQPAAPHAAVPPPAPGPSALPAALDELRTAVDATRLTLEIPGAAAARRLRGELLATLDDHVLPRLRRSGAPVLVVVAGPTGAGKSTLVNSLVRATASPSGALRPTTRAAVLVCNPADTPSYAGGGALSGLRPVDGPTSDPRTVRVVASVNVPRGIAVLDAPDVDSVVAADRALATRLLAAADVWLFVLTASRYADAVPWRHLATARDRGAVLVVVVDRVPPEAVGEVHRYVGELLAERGLAGTPVFTIAEKPLVDGLLDEFDVVRLRDWLQRVAADSTVSDAIVRQAVEGAVRALPDRTRALAEAVSEQHAAGRALADDLVRVYAAAGDALNGLLASGDVVAGELRVRWLEYVEAGGLESLTAPARRGLFRRRGPSAPAAPLGDALEAAVVAAVGATARIAAVRVRTSWGERSGDATLLGAVPDTPSATMLETAAEALRGWATASGSVSALVALGAPTVAADTSEAVRDLLGDAAVRQRAEAARADLARRLTAVLVGERDRIAARSGLAALVAPATEDLLRATASIERSLL